MVLISEMMKHFVCSKNCIHWQYEPLEENGMRWMNKQKTKYKRGTARICLPEALTPENGSIGEIQKYQIFLIAIPKEELHKQFPETK